MDLVRTQATFNKGALSLKGLLDEHYFTDLGWTLDSATVETYEYINNEGQFIPVIPEDGEIVNTNPQEILINLSGLFNKLVRVKYHINMNTNPYILCGFEIDPDDATVVIQSYYTVDLYEFHIKSLNYMSSLENNCCTIPSHLTDTILKYFLLKSALTVKDAVNIINLYTKLYFDENSTVPTLQLHGGIVNYNSGCNCHG